MGHEECADKTCQKICEIKDRLIDVATRAVCGEIEQCDAHELGEVVDMIKDCVQAEKDIHEKCYYDSVVEAMKDESFEHADHSRTARYNKPMHYMDRSYDQRMQRRDWNRNDNWDHPKPRHGDETFAHNDQSRYNWSDGDMSSDDRFDRVMKDIKVAWNSATPDLRKRMKSDITKLVGDMTV